MRGSVACAVAFATEGLWRIGYGGAATPLALAMLTAALLIARRWRVAAP